MSTQSDPNPDLTRRLPFEAVSQTCAEDIAHFVLDYLLAASAHSVAVDTAGGIYVTGDTRSDDFPANPDCFDPTYGGNTGAWIAKLP